MAKLYITEYYLAATLPNNPTQVPLEPPLAEQVIDFTGGPALSTPFQQTTRMVRLHCDATCSLVLGQNPSASTSSGRFATNQTEFRGVPEGQSFRVSVIANV